MIQIITMAFRNLGRNRRRSFFSALAVAMGLTLLLMLASFVKGEMDGALNTSIRLQSGHLQVRAKTYAEDKSSLKWEDLIAQPDAMAASISALAPVKVATPRLLATGIVAVRDETAGVRIIGIDPASSANDPYRNGMVSGTYLAADDLEGLLMGKALADKLAVKAGDSINLSANTSNGDVAQQQFVIRGIYSTNTFGFDGVTVFLPLAKAQTLTQTENHASTIFILLKDQNQTDAVVAALQGSNFQVLTWRSMNDIIIQTESMANSYMVIFYLIILAVTASVILNTLVMAVFERTREIGILMAVGMKGRRILAIFLTESAMIAFIGILLGLPLGGLIVGYFSTFGFHIGNLGTTGLLIGDTIYASWTWQNAITLSIAALIVAILAGLIPAVMASRMEPVAALRAEK